MGTKAKARVTVGQGRRRPRSGLSSRFKRTAPSQGRYVSSPGAGQSSIPKSIGQTVGGGKKCSLVSIIIGVVVIAVIGGIAYMVSRGGSGGITQTATEPTPTISVSDGCSISRAEVSYLGEDTSFSGYHKIKVQFCNYLIEGSEYDVEVERTVTGSTVKYDVEVDLSDAYEEDYYDEYESQMTFIVEDSLEPGTYSFEVNVSGEISGSYSLGPLNIAATQ